MYCSVAVSLLLLHVVFMCVTALYSCNSSNNNNKTTNRSDMNITINNKRLKKFNSTTHQYPTPEQKAQCNKHTFLCNVIRESESKGNL